MLQLILENPVRFILALVIGIATAWWIWGRMSSGAATQDDGASARPSPTPAPPPAPEPKSESKPEPAPVAPVAAAAAFEAKSDSGDNKPKIAAAVGEPDDLTRIKGIGPKLNELCHSLGVMRFDQIAKWSAADVAEVDQYLKIKGRIDRDEWVAQAKLLADGDVAGHKTKYGLA